MREHDPLTQFTVRMPPDLHKQAQALAKKDFMSLNSWLLRLVAAEIAREAEKGNAPTVGAVEASITR